MGRFGTTKIYGPNRTLQELSRMTLMNSVTFTVLKILRNLASMPISLNANSCKGKQNFENCPT